MGKYSQRDEYSNGERRGAIRAKSVGCEGLPRRGDN